MSKNYCLVCNKRLENTNLVEAICSHAVGKYQVYIHYDGTVNIYPIDDNIVSNKLLKLKYPKRLNEDYIDMMLLLR